MEPLDSPSPPDRSRTRRIWSGALFAILIVAGVLIGARSRTPAAAVVDPDDGMAVGMSAGRDASASAAAATVPAVLNVEPEPTTTGTTLPLPDPPPRDQYAPTPNVPLATITIPKLKVTVTMFEGVTLTAVDRGSGHWPGTPQPGDLGNMVVAGHRTLYQKPFARLDELGVGDKVLFTKTDGSVFTYAVRGTIIVPADNIGVASQHSAHTATLFACHPRGQATHRIVTKLALLGPDGKPVDAEADLPPMDVGLRPNDGTLVVRDYGDNPNVSPLDPLTGAQQ